MLTAELTALATLAGQAIVRAASTDAWEMAKQGFARLIGRRDPAQTELAQQRLEQTRDQLATQDGAGLEQASSVLMAQWSTRLTDLLEENPGLQADMRALVEQIENALPIELATAVDHSVSAGRDVSLRADHGSISAGVIHGNVTPANPIQPGPENG
jgi:hypothetical protein